jgi:hypothetical protein
VFCSIILFAGPDLAQQQQGGIVSGVNAAPVYDQQKRPIMAGGFVDSGPIIFEGGWAAGAVAQRESRSSPLGGQGITGAL